MPRPSRVDQLDPELRELLVELLEDPAVTQLEAGRRLNVLLKERGEEPLSKSSVHRYAQRVDKVGEKMRQSREMAEVLASQVGNVPQGKTGKLLNQMLRGLVFDVLMVKTEDGGEINPKALSALALTLQRLEASATANDKLAEEISKRERVEAAESAVASAKRSGVSEETIEQIRRDVLGMDE